MNAITAIRIGGARLLISNRALAHAAIRLCCDERLLTRIIESDLFLIRLRQSNEVLLTFKALLTDNTLLERLLSDPNIADKILLQDKFVDHALSNYSLRERASKHLGIIDAVAENRKAWQRFLTKPEFVKFAVESDQAFAEITNNQALLTKLVHEPTVTDRLLSEDDLAQRIIADTRMQDQLRANGEVLMQLALEDATFNTLVAKEEFLARCVANASFVDALLSDPNVVRTAVQTEPFLDNVLAHETTFKHILRDDALMKQLLDDPGTASKILDNGRLLDRILSDERAFDKLLADERLLTLLLTHGLAFEKLMSDDTLLTKLLSHQRTFDKLLADERLLTRLLSHGLVFEKLMSDDTLLTKLLSHQRAFDKILTDDFLLGRILSHGRALGTISSNPVLLNKLLSIEGVVQHLADNEALFARWASNSMVIQAFRRSPKLLSKILNHGIAMDGLATQRGFLTQTLNNDRVMHNLFRERRMTERLLAKDADSERIRAIQVFHETWERLMPVVDLKQPGLDERVIDTAQNLHRVKDVRKAVLKLITNRKRAMLAHGKMAFTDDFSLWTLLHEILLNEEYYFECLTDTPYVLDCGANFGMATYYFKSLYPDARITAFEPVPQFRKMAMSNVKRNEYQDVEVLPYALAGKAGKTTFYVSEEFPLASTLTKRRHTMGDTLHEITVQRKRLSGYLDCPVNFLKLDIEGAEDEVLEECKDKLDMVQSMFIEYHHGAGMAEGRLQKIISILDEAGFDYHMQKAFNFGESTGQRSITQVTGPYSLVIWAKNRNWEHDG